MTGRGRGRRGRSGFPGALAVAAGRGGAAVRASRAGLGPERAWCERVALAGRAAWGGRGVVWGRRAGWLVSMDARRLALACCTFAG